MTKLEELNETIKSIFDAESQIEVLNKQHSSFYEDLTKITHDLLLEGDYLPSATWSFFFADTAIYLSAKGNLGKLVEFYDLIRANYQSHHFKLQIDLDKDVSFIMVDRSNFDINFYDLDIFPSMVRKLNLNIDFSPLKNDLKTAKKQLIRLEKLAHQFNVK